MSAVPVAYYLTELGQDPSRGRRIRQKPGISKAEADDAARLEAARAEGLQEGRASAEAEYERKLKEQIADAEAKLVEARETWVQEQGEALSNRITNSLTELEQHIGDQIARIIKPVLASQSQERALESLRETVDGILSKGGLRKVEVIGPEDLLAKMRDKFEGTDAGVSYVTAPICDLKITVDETILETRIGAWAQAIEGRDA
jgi:hypothetical protein